MPEAKRRQVGEAAVVSVVDRVEVAQSAMVRPETSTEEEMPTIDAASARAGGAGATSVVARAVGLRVTTVAAVAAAAM